MDGHQVGLTEQLFLRNQNRASRSGDLWRHVLAPGNNFHPKGESDARDLYADIAQAEHA